MAERQKIEWILFDEHPFRTFRNHSPRAPGLFHLSEHAFRWNHIINLPVPKPHYLTRVSIAMKNLKGFIKREDKPSFHHCGTEGISGSVAELNLIIKPSLNIVDCTSLVHNNSRFILAGTDIVATDAATASFMGINPEHIPVIKKGFLAGLGEMRLSEIEFAGDDLKDIDMNFEQPSEYLKRAFPNLELKAETACSGCLIPLFSSLRRLETAGIKIQKKTGLLLGKESNRGNIIYDLLIGRCATGSAHGRSLLNACPPSKDELYELLRDALRDN